MVIEADDNLVEYVGVTNAGRTLFMTTEDKLRRPAYSQLRVTVYLRQLQHLDIASEGHVTCAEPLVAVEPLEIKVQSVGNTQLVVQASQLTLHCACQSISTAPSGSALFWRGAGGEVCGAARVRCFGFAQHDGI